MGGGGERNVSPTFRFSLNDSKNVSYANFVPPYASLLWVPWYAPVARRNKNNAYTHIIFFSIFF
jgi:hypothetical protein